MLVLTIIIIGIAIITVYTSYHFVLIYTRLGLVHNQFTTSKLSVKLTPQFLAYTLDHDESLTKESHNFLSNWEHHGRHVFSFKDRRRDCNFCNRPTTVHSVLAFFCYRRLPQSCLRRRLQCL